MIRKCNLTRLVFQHIIYNITFDLCRFQWFIPTQKPAYKKKFFKYTNSQQVTCNEKVLVISFKSLKNAFINCSLF